MAREGDNVLAALEQPIGDVLAGVGKCARDSDVHDCCPRGARGATSAKNPITSPTTASAARKPMMFCPSWRARSKNASAAGSAAGRKPRAAAAGTPIKSTVEKESQK